MVYLGRYIWRGIWYFLSERSVIVLRKSGPIQTHLDLVALACCVANSPWAMLGVDTDLWRAPPDPTGLPSTPPCASSIPSPIICLEPGWCWWWLWCWPPPPPPHALTSSSSLSPVLSLGLLTRPLLAAARRCPPLPVARWPAFPWGPFPRPLLRGVSRVSPSAPDSIAREGHEEESLDSTACFSTPTLKHFFIHFYRFNYIDCLCFKKIGFVFIYNQIVMQPFETKFNLLDHIYGTKMQKFLRFGVPQVPLCICICVCICVCPCICFCIKISPTPPLASSGSTPGCPQAGKSLTLRKEIVKAGFLDLEAVYDENQKDL